MRRWSHSVRGNNCLKPFPTQPPQVTPHCPTLHVGARAPKAAWFAGTSQIPSIRCNRCNIDKTYLSHRPKSIQISKNQGKALPRYDFLWLVDDL
jgi:hypothetical protein